MSLAWRVARMSETINAYRALVGQPKRMRLPEGRGV